MTKDWKKIVQASGLTIPATNVDRIAQALDALEVAFRPLARGMGRETDPAVVFQADVEDGA